MIPVPDASHARADRLDDPGALVAEHGGATRLRGPVDRVLVRVAHTAGGEADEHLTRPRRSERELLDGERASGALEHRSPEPHAGTASRF